MIPLRRRPTVHEASAEQRACPRVARHGKFVRGSWRMGWLLVLALAASPAAAFVVSISRGPPPVIYLQVGVGSFSGVYTSGGSPQDNPLVNVVSVDVPVSALLSPTELQMTSDSTQVRSFYDGRTFCSPPDQVYIGGFYRRPGASGAATIILTATVTQPLTSAAGDTIPFSRIRWTASSDRPPAGIPSGRFVDQGTQTLAVFNRNQWRESCLTFFFETGLDAAGVYTGRVIYTLGTP
jgi:hypothetical protein